MCICGVGSSKRHCWLGGGMDGWKAGWMEGWMEMDGVPVFSSQQQPTGLRGRCIQMFIGPIASAKKNMQSSLHARSPHPVKVALYMYRHTDRTCHTTSRHFVVPFIKNIEHATFSTAYRIASLVPSIPSTLIHIRVARSHFGRPAFSHFIIFRLDPKCPAAPSKEPRYAPVPSNSR